jgi:hypothetical protein
MVSQDAQLSSKTNHKCQTQHDPELWFCGSQEFPIAVMNDSKFTKFTNLVHVYSVHCIPGIRVQVHTAVNLVLSTTEYYRKGSLERGICSRGLL